MLDWIFLVIGFVLSICYAYNVWNYTQKNKAIYSSSSVEAADKNMKGISVLIPFRNERATLGAQLNSLLLQEVDAWNIEFIYINDHSEDRGVDDLLPFVEKGLIRLYHLGREDSGKKAALEYGVAQARYPWIVTTDADCIYGHQWLQAMANQMHEQVDACCGPVAISGRNRFIHSFQFWDMLAVMGMTAAGHRGLDFAMANGANFAFRRSVFEELGGYEGVRHLASGDDMFMVSKIAKRKESSVVFVDDVDAVVYTAAIDHWWPLFQQRLRWSGKTSAYKDIRLKYHIAISFLFTCFILVVGLFSLWMPEIMAFAFVFLLFRLMVDFTYLQFMAKKYAYPGWDRYFPFVQMFHILYIAVIGLSALLMKSYTWKGRILR